MKLNFISEERIRLSQKRGWGCLSPGGIFSRGKENYHNEKNKYMLLKNSIHDERRSLRLGG